VEIFFGYMVINDVIDFLISLFVGFIPRYNDQCRIDISFGVV